MPSFLCWPLKFCASRIHLDVIEIWLRLTFFKGLKFVMKLGFSLLKMEAAEHCENSYFSLYLLDVVLKIKLCMNNEYMCV